MQLGAVDGTLSYSGYQPNFTFVDFSTEHSFALSKQAAAKHLKLSAGVKNLLNVQSLFIPGVVAVGPHNGTSSLNFLGRSLFITLQYQL
jgi:hypothetical protein